MTEHVHDDGTVHEHGSGVLHTHREDLSDLNDRAASQAAEELRRNELPAPEEPMAVAERLVARQHRDGDGLLTLRSWRGSFHRWDEGVWVEYEDAATRAWLYRLLQDAWYMKGGNPTPWAPNRRKVADVLEALRALTHVDGFVQPPAWLDGPRSVPAHELVAVRNGLLHVRTRTPFRHTPRLFNVTKVPFDYDPVAPSPRVWLWFMSALWPSDPESVAALQEWFGYVISGDTRLHKILLIFGPIRSGKGTIGRVLTALLGERNVAGPTLSSLATNFGLQPLVGKPLALVSDARIGGGNVHQVVERLLSVSGEDTQTVDRKYKEPWTGRLGTRFMIMTNELPRLGDAAGAAATRFIPLTLTESWLGKEDHDLEEKLRAELPGILNWSLEGLARLQAQGRFTEPAGADETITSLQDVGSPVAAFARDRCVREPNRSVWQDDLYATYRGWCLLNGHTPRNTSWFGRDLRAVDPRIKLHRLESPLDRDDVTELHRFKAGDRPYYYTGIGLS